MRPGRSARKPLGNGKETAAKCNANQKGTSPRLVKNDATVDGVPRRPDNQSGDHDAACCMVSGLHL